MRKMWFGIVGVVAALAACGSGGSGASGGAGQSSSAGGGTTSTATTAQGGTCLAQSSFDGTKETVQAILEAALAGFTVEGAISINPTLDIPSFVLSTSAELCGAIKEKPCTPSVGCTIDAHESGGTVAPGTYDASGANAASNPGGAEAKCYVSVTLPGCGTGITRPAAAGSTLTITAIDANHIAGSVSLTFKESVDAPSAGGVNSAFDAPVCKGQIASCYAE